MTPDITPIDTTEEKTTIADDKHIPAGEKTGIAKWAPLVVLALALAIIIIDTTILNVSLRTIIDDLHTNIKSIQWVITAYSLMLAAFTITGGRLGDLFGRKKMFMLGAVIFAVGSFITSISHHVGILIMGEAIVEGIGAVLMLPATASLLLANYRGRDRAVAFGVWGGIAAASAALGPVLGGWLTTHYSWRWAFRINIVVAIVLVIGAIIIKESRDDKEKPELDIFGIILSSLGLLSLVYGFIESSTYGWFKAKDQLVLLHHALNLGSLSVTPVFVLLGLVILVFFAMWQKHRQTSGHTPLVSLDLFKNRQFVTGSLITSIMTIGMAGLSFSLPVFLQGVRNLNPFDTGLAMLPMPLAIFVSAPLSAYLVKYITPKRMIQVALLIASTGFLILRSAIKVDATTWSLLPGFAIFGFGMGFMFSQLSNLTLSAVDVSEAGEASGVNNTFRQLGQSLGSAILGAILISSLGSNLVAGVQNSQVIPAQAKPALSDTFNKQASSIEFGGDTSSTQSIPAALSGEITNIVHKATTDAAREVTIYGIAFLILAFGISFALDNAHAHEHADYAPKAGAEEGAAGAAGAETGAAGAMALSEEDKDKDEDDEQDEPNSSSGSAGSSAGISGARAAAITVAAVVVLGGAAGASGYYAGKHKAVPPIVVQQTIAQPQSNQVAGSSEWTPLFNPTVPPTSVDSGVAVTPDPAEASTAKVAGATTNTPVAAQTYTDSNVKFTMNMPADWKVVSKSSEVTLATPDHHAYSIQSYPTGTTNNDLDGLHNFLNQQSNISNVTATTFNGYQGFSFDVAGYYKKGYAILSGGRLYYILGTVMSDSALSSFKTI